MKTRTIEENLRRRLAITATGLALAAASTFHTPTATSRRSVDTISLKAARRELGDGEPYRRQQGRDPASATRPTRTALAAMTLAASPAASPPDLRLLDVNDDNTDSSSSARSQASPAMAPVYMPPFEGMQ